MKRMLVAVAMVLLAGQAAWAQPGPPGGQRGKGPGMGPGPGGGPCQGEDCPPWAGGPWVGGMQGGKIKERLEQLRLDLLREEVGLNEEKIKQVTEIMDRYRKLDEEVFRKLRSVYLRLEALVVENETDQSKYKDLLAEAKKLPGERHKIKMQEFDALQNILTPIEQAKFILSIGEARKKFRERVRTHERRFSPDSPAEEADEPPFPPPP